MTIKPFRIHREFAGSLADLGTLLPLALGLIAVCGMSPLGVFVSVGITYILTGIYFRLPVAVQPMKYIAAYAVATVASAGEITAAGLVSGLVLLLVGLTPMMRQITKYIPTVLIRSVQIYTGILLVVKGVSFIFGIASFQKLQGLAEPFLREQMLFGLPVNIILGSCATILILIFSKNRYFPAALVVLLFALVTSLFLGRDTNVELGFFLPQFFPFGFPSADNFIYAFFLLVLPQFPMTVTNAVLATSNLSKEYFHEKSSRVTNKALCISMAIANILSAILGGIPLCHGAGGLAAHYSFGARTYVSNIIIGVILLLAGIFLGENSTAVVAFLPLSVLGAFLIFAGLNLTKVIFQIRAKEDMAVLVSLVLVSFLSNFIWGFLFALAVYFLIGFVRRGN